ncbi:MAG TPA: BA14K family protein [Mesorhizobium sp.]|jgi:hypothetical protein|nr:BA14K family protein [Mesorhizobium sp.]
MLHRAAWAFSALLAACIPLAGATAASAGTGQDVVIVEVRRGVPWYDQPPYAGTAKGHYYRHHTHHIPAYPGVISGYPVPIYRTDNPLSTRLLVRPAASRLSAHIAWCQAHYRSYSAATDTFQPYHGPRRRCASPYR